MKRLENVFLVVVMAIICCTFVCLNSSANDINIADSQLTDLKSDTYAELNVGRCSILSSDSLIQAINTINSNTEEMYPITLDNIKSTSDIAITTAVTYNRDFYFGEAMSLLNDFEEDIQSYESIYGPDFQVINDMVTNSYNCHAYAWYGAPGNGSCWIDNPYEFIKDSHCDRVTNNVYDGNVQVGDIVYFYIGEEYTGEGPLNHEAVHSSIVDSIYYVDGTIKIRLESKFGPNGVYSHSFESTSFFYFYNNYTVYRYVQGEHETTYTSVDSYRHIEGCGKCEYTEYVAHNNSCITVSTTQHRYTCRDCGFSKSEEHTPQYTVYSNEEHKVRCSDCGYTIYEDHDLYVSDAYNDVYTIECRECSYSINCNCDREYVSDGSSGHYYNCIEGCFSEFESHTHELTGEYNSSGHEVECTYCGYSDFIDHDLYMYSAAPEDYVVKCHDCTYTVECWESPEYYGNSNDGHWVDCACGCYSFFEPHTPGSYINAEDGSHDAVCADCGYIYTEVHTFGSSTSASNSSYHFFECTECGYERAETHVFTYTMIANNVFKHNAYCRVCGDTYTKPHNWVSVSGGYRCSDCRMPTSFIPDYSSLSNEELELLLSSMSEEELEAFIALLPEDAVARVTAILPPDDEHLTE